MVLLLAPVYLQEFCFLTENVRSGSELCGLGVQCIYVKSADISLPVRPRYTTVLHDKSLSLNTFKQNFKGSLWRLTNTIWHRSSVSCDFGAVQVSY